MTTINYRGDMKGGTKRCYGDVIGVLWLIGALALIISSAVAMGSGGSVTVFFRLFFVGVLLLSVFLGLVMYDSMRLDE